MIDDIRFFSFRYFLRFSYVDWDCYFLRPGCFSNGSSMAGRLEISY